MIMCLVIMVFYTYRDIAMEWYRQVKNGIEITGMIHSSFMLSSSLLIQWPDGNSWRPEARQRSGLPCQHLSLRLPDSDGL